MISPEERMGVDNVISVMVTVSDVEVSNDLQVVKVFVSILGDERGKQNAINGLKKMEGYCRRNIGKKVSLPRLKRCVGRLQTSGWTGGLSGIGPLRAKSYRS